MMWLWAAMLWSAVSASSTTSTTGTLISSSEGRLPMSLSTIVADLEAQGECSEQLVTACFLSSRSVSRRKQATILQELLLMGEETDAEQPVTVSTKACGLSSGLIICRPSASLEDKNEIVPTACACGGNVVYYADPIDLCRGEGLFDQLAPVMEQLLQQQETLASRKEDDDEKRDTTGTTQPLFSAPTLVVIVEYGDLSKARAAFEQVAEFFVSNLSSNANGSNGSSRRVQVLQDIFARVEYVSSPAEAAQVLLTTKASSPLTTLTVMDRIADATRAGGGGSSFSLRSPEDCAAAGLVGPAARAQVERVVQRIQQASVDNEGTTVLVPSFGALVDVAVQQALDELPTIHHLSNQLLSSRVGKEIQSNFLSDVCAELGPLFQEQLDLLEKTSFEDFRKALSRLLVSPNLKTDMDNVITTSVAAFGKAAQPLSAKQLAPLSSWQALVGPAKQRFRKRLQDFCHSRLLTAQASGQYRPLPRKGVTVGFHYLLPKPFGNDFRQEPWMVHATDNMVYIPKDGITDVRPEDVAAGDWRDKIVPSPVGNDMIYMQ